MFRRSRSVVVAVLAAATLASLVPPAGALGYCQARYTGIGTGFTETVLVTGEYAPVGAIDVVLTCGVVKNGSTVARFTDGLTGPAALVAGTVNLTAGTISACYESTVYYPDGNVTLYDGCP
ncbi:MAG TPA: hypothetical protein VG318_15250 [Actinomycetota bacterium]|nr:hypothetical protein [Actinomycetota bacterium]